MMRTPRTITLEQLLANTKRRGQCRTWRGTVRKDGYAQIGLNGKKLKVTRLVYALVHPAEKMRDHHAVVHVHSCRYSDCIEPEHLIKVPTSEAWRYRKSEQTT